MARAYIVLNRNDLPNNMLQVLDLKPNSSQFLPASEGQDSGQTGYQTWWAGDAAINSAALEQGGAGGGASVDADGDQYGLAPYLMSTVEDQVTNAAITDAVANATRNSIFAKVVAGTALTADEIEDSLTNNGVSDAGAGTTLTAGDSTGDVEEVLRILAGEVFRLDDNTQITDAAGDFDPNGKGSFVTRPNVENPASVQGTYGPVRGRKFNSPLPYIRPGESRAGQTPVQTGRQDTLFRDVRVVVDTGELQLSAQSGALADLKGSSYVFENPSFTYGGGVTPARNLSGTSISTTHEARAVVVYDASGNII
jgi:hypothetical protein